MNDMLLKQLRGRYNDCRLTCVTNMDLSFAANISEQELEKLLKVKMATQIATTIVDSKKAMWKVSPSSAEFYGKQYQIQTYTFHPEQFEQLIKDAFNAGVESMKGQQ